MVRTFVTLPGAVLVASVATLAPPAAAQVINELLVSTTGTDVEFAELFGPPGTSLAGLSLINIESDDASGSIDSRFDFPADAAIGSNGFFLLGNGSVSTLGAMPDLLIADNFFENSSSTIALVETASLADGTIDGSEIVRDAVGLSDGTGAGFSYGAPVLGPDGPNYPSSVNRIPDGGAFQLVDAFSPAGAGTTPTAGRTPPLEPTTATIMQIQGAGQVSPFEGERVATTGVVTLLGGSVFWIQDPLGDGDARTSDGILVNRGPDGLAPGDLVTVVGTVEEQQFGDALPLTRLNAREVSVTSSGTPLPAPVALVELPDQDVQAGIAFFEPLEGMLVEAGPGWVVAPTNRFGEFAFVTSRNAAPGSGFRLPARHLFLTATGENQVDYNPERILVDDSSLEEAISTRPGDRVRSISGVVDYTFGNYKLQPKDFDIQDRIIGQVFNRQGGRGDLTVTSFNVENLFDTVDDPDKDDERSNLSPAELATKLDKLALAITDELNLPAILVVQEVETTEVLQMLGDRVNTAAGTSYLAVSFESSDRRGIEVGFLYDVARVGLNQAFQLGTGASAALADQVAAAFGPDSASPGREPLVGAFQIGDRSLWIINNHFKSKGGDDPIFGIDSLNGLPFGRRSEEQRKLQAQVVRDAADLLFEQAGPDALVMVAGDLNDFPFGEPGEGADHPLAILEGGADEVPLTNLVEQERPWERFTYIFDGNSQVLDHILVSPALLGRLRGIDMIHLNASFPASLADDPEVAHRSSDHDPVEARFAFPAQRLAER